MRRILFTAMLMLATGLLYAQSVTEVMKKLDFTVFNDAYIKKIDYETEYTCGTYYFKPFISISQDELARLDKAQGSSAFTLNDLQTLYESGSLAWTIVLKTSNKATSDDSHTRVYYTGSHMDKVDQLSTLLECYKLRLEGKDKMTESLLKYTIMDEAIRAWNEILELED